MTELNISQELLKNTKVHHTPPPKDLYTRCQEAFGDRVNWEKGTVFTYGTDIYTKYELDKPLFSHEFMHVCQQMSFEGGPEAWWKAYFESDDFRLNQELECYQIQYHESKKFIKDKNQLFRYLRQLAILLSGPMYGNLLSTDEAMKLIKQ